MVWKCPPLHLFNWNNAWKWKNMDNETKLKIEQSDKILKKIKDDGLDAHSGLCWEALQHFLYDTLDGEDFERLKREFNIK
jgi:hypothetical protein